MSAKDTWLPSDFEHPLHVPLQCGLHLRPIRGSDVDIDLPAVLGSQQRLWAQYGQAWGWPPATMTREQDHEDLVHHEQEIERHESFNYCLLDADETALYGCVYLDPVETAAADSEDGPGGAYDAEVSWWVVDELVGTEAETELNALVPAWVASRWPFHAVRFPFNDCSATTAAMLQAVHEGRYDDPAVNGAFQRRA